MQTKPTNHIRSLTSWRIFWTLVVLVAGVWGQVYGQGNRKPSDSGQILFFSEQRLTLENIIVQIEDETEFRFVYSKDLIATQDEIRLKTSSLSVRSVLDEVAQSAGLSYQIKGQSIFLLPQPNTERSSYLLSGYVRDYSSGEAMIGAIVYDTVSQRGIYTNNYGFFSLDLPHADAVIMVQYLGYERQFNAIHLDARTSREFRLKSGDTELEAVTISDEELDFLSGRAAISHYKISPRELNQIPAMLGEPDLLRSLQLLPGVRGGQEGTVGLYVRGGGPDQNLILIDDVPVYNPTHLFGFASAFNTASVEDIELTTGGFPARYGGRLSSVLDVRLKEGNLRHYQADASLGLLSSNLLLEGPIVKEKGSFMVSGRRSYLDLLGRPAQKWGQRNNPFDKDLTGIHFSDLNGKINYKLSDRDRLYFSAYASRDNLFRNQESTDRNNPQMTFDSNMGLSWANRVASLRWNHLFSERLFLNATAFSSRYEYQYHTGEQFYDGAADIFRIKDEVYQSNIRDVGGRLDLYWRPAARHTFRTGGMLVRKGFLPGSHLLTITTPDSDFLEEFIANKVLGVEANVYVEDEIKLGERWDANIGLHGAGFSVEGTRYVSLQPRLSTQYQFNPRIGLKASFVTMQQNVHLLTTNGLEELPLDLWMPTTDEILPMRSWQMTVGTGGNLGKSYAWTAEMYMKHIQNNIAYDDGALLFDGRNNWEEEIIRGERRAEGVELFLRRRKGRLTGWLGYTLSRTRNRFDELNRGEWFFDRYDRRHDISLTLQYKLSDKLNFTCNWVYATGNTVTLPIAGYSSLQGTEEDEVPDELILIYGDRNNFRLPSTHRLDLGLSFYKKKKWGERWWNIGVYNAYNRLNPMFVEQSLSDHPNGNSRFNYDIVTYFPLMPSVSYRIKIGK